MASSYHTRGKMDRITWTAIAVIVLIIIAGAVVVTNPTGNVVKEEVIKIGAILPLSGETAIWGENARNGIELAREQISRAGGIDGRKIEVIYEDTQCDPAKTASAIQKLINIDKTRVVIGEVCSSATLAAAPIAEQNRVVLISPGSSADSISQAGDFIFRNYPRNSQILGRAIEVIEKLNKNRAAVLYVNNDYGAGLKDYALEKIPKERIVLVEGHGQKETDFRTTLTKLKNADPDVVILATYYNDGGLILKQAREMEIEALFISTESLDDPKVIEIAGEAAEGLIISTVKSGAGPEFSGFKQAYRERYGKEPGLLCDFGYDSLNIIAESLMGGDYSGETIRDGLYSIKDYPGASNLISFDGNGDLANPMFAMKIVRNGQFVPYGK